MNWIYICGGTEQSFGKYLILFGVEQKCQSKKQMELKNKLKKIILFISK